MIESCVVLSELPPLVSSGGFFSFVFVSRRGWAVLLLLRISPFLKQAILNGISHDSIIPVFSIARALLVRLGPGDSRILLFTLYYRYPGSCDRDNTSFTPFGWLTGVFFSTVWVAEKYLRGCHKSHRPRFASMRRRICSSLKNANKPDIQQSHLFYRASNEKWMSQCINSDSPQLSDNRNSFNISNSYIILSYYQ